MKKNYKIGIALGGGAARGYAHIGVLNAIDELGIPISYVSGTSIWIGNDTDTLVPMKGKDYRGETHWWLQDDDKIYDVTADQYYSVGQTPPYESGKKSKWYGWKQRPQQITLDLMKRVLDTRMIKDVASKVLP